MHRVIVDAVLLGHARNRTSGSSSLRSVSVDCLCVRRSMLGIGRWTFPIFGLWHQFHPAFRTSAGVILDHFRMHYAGVLGGFRFRSLRQECRCDRRD
jgi:hypothetical protein